MRFPMRVVSAVAVALMGAAQAGAEEPTQVPAEEPTRVPAEERTFTATQFQSDLDTMYRTLQSAAFDLNAFTPKAQMDRVYASLRAGCPYVGAEACSFDHPLTRIQMQERLQLLAAAAHQGHARVDGPYTDWATYRKGGGKAFPLNIRIVHDRMFVAENLSGLDSIHRGDEITAINGVTAREWRVRTSRHISAETQYMADSILEYDFPIYLWVDAGAFDTFTVTLRGEAVTVPART